MPITAPSIVSYGSDRSETGDITLVSDPDTTTDEWLIAVHGCDYYSLSDLLPPSNTSINLQWSDVADDGDASYGHPHVKIWAIRAPGGAVAIQFNRPLDAGHHAALAVVSGTSGPAGGAGAFSTAVTTAHALPSLDAVVVPALLLGAVIGLTDGVTALAYDPPTGMVERSETVRPTPWSTMGVYTTTVADAGATGSKVVTASAAREYAGAALLLPGVDAGASPPAGFRGWGIPL